MDVEYSNNAEDARPRTIHHRAVVHVNEQPLTVSTLRAAADALATDPRVPPWATVQFVYPDVHAFWQTTEAGTRL
jgi:hypothetical protein